MRAKSKGSLGENSRRICMGKGMVGAMRELARSSREDWKLAAAEVNADREQ